MYIYIYICIHTYGYDTSGRVKSIHKQLKNEWWIQILFKVLKVYRYNELISSTSPVTVPGASQHLNPALDSLKIENIVICCSKRRHTCQPCSNPTWIYKLSWILKRQSEDNTGRNDIVSRCDLDILLKEFVTKRRPHSFVQHSLYFHSFGPASHGTAGYSPHDCDLGLEINKGLLWLLRFTSFFLSNKSGPT